MGLFSLRGGIEGLAFFRYEKTRKRGAFLRCMDRAFSHGGAFLISGMRDGVCGQTFYPQAVCDGSQRSMVRKGDGGEPPLCPLAFFSCFEYDKE